MRECCPRNGTPETAAPDQCFKLAKHLQYNAIREIIGLSSTLQDRGRNDVSHVKGGPLI